MQSMKDCATVGVQMAERVERLLGSTLARLVNIAHVDWHAEGTFARGASVGSVALSSMIKADARASVSRRLVA
jgi:hypothetical protein